MVLHWPTIIYYLPQKNIYQIPGSLVYENPIMKVVPKPYKC